MAVIAFDARNVRAVPSGIGRVAACLIRKLARIDDENEYLLIQHSALRDPLVESPRIRVLHLNYDIATLRSYLGLSQILRVFRPDVYHSLHAFLPLRLPPEVRTVVTIHDFNWVQRPSIAGPAPWRGWVSGLHARPMHRYSVRMADHIVCISGQTRRDLDSLYPGVKNPISVVHNGVDPDAMRTGAAGAKVERYRVCRFILSVGSGRASKNPEGTLRAFAQIKTEPRHADVRLLMVGCGGKIAKLRALAGRYGVGDSVDFAGMVSDADLVFLLEHALLLSFPSRWEGFGLPVVEAFACGCPVVASNLASLIEVASGAAWMLDDPDSTQEIATAMRALINNAAIRERLRLDGLRRAKQFTWDNAAAAYLEIYERLLRAPFGADELAQEKFNER